VSVEQREALPEQEFKENLLAIIPVLRAFARGLCGRPDLADDLAQEALTKAWAARASFNAGTNFKAWMFMILRNHYFSTYRKQKRMVSWDPEITDALMTTGEAQTGAVEFAELYQALRTLPDEQREAVILIGAGGFSYEEAAQIGGCAVGTIKSRVGRARAALRGLISGETPMNPSDRPKSGVAQEDLSSEIVPLQKLSIAT
jgi:RNA polymerase sigma-70 factor (ECF subfamily)